MFKTMWALLFLVLLVVLVDWGNGQYINFDGHIRDYAVSNSSLYILTEDHLYKVSHDLAQTNAKISNRGILDGKVDGKFQRISETSSHAWNATYKVNMLVPFIRNNTLITCGSLTCGYCDVLDINDISKSVHSEHIEVSPNGSTIGLLVDIKTPGTYVLVGSMFSSRKDCPPNNHVVTLLNTNDAQSGGIFSTSDSDQTPVSIETDRNGADLTFVDGFQHDQYIYLFRNQGLSSKLSVRLIWLKISDSKKSTLGSMQGAKLQCCKDRERPRLLSSSVIPGGATVRWAGVFTGNDTSDPMNTALAIYDISQGTGPDPNFSCKQCKKDETVGPTKQLHPISVVFRYKSMTSVLALIQGSWVVLFIGTGDGQLIKLAVDKNYHTSCSRVIFRSNHDVQVFPKMHLDPLDPKHMYMVLQNQMKRVPVATCSLQKTLKDCWSAQDPLCGWCDSENRCMFQDECSGSAWLSIPEDSNQHRIISHQLEGNGTGQNITLTIQAHLSVTGGGSPDFSCHVSGSGILCGPSFPICTCLLYSDLLVAKGLDLTVKIKVGREQLVEELKLTNSSHIREPLPFDLCSQSSQDSIEKTSENPMVIIALRACLPILLLVITGVVVHYFYKKKKSKPTEEMHGLNGT